LSAGRLQGEPTNACNTLVLHLETSRLIAKCELPVGFGSFVGDRRTDGWQNAHWRVDKTFLKKRKMKRLRLTD